MARRLSIFLPWRCIVCLRRMVCWPRFLLSTSIHPSLPPLFHTIPFTTYHTHLPSFFSCKPAQPADNPPSPESPANALTPDAHLKTLQLGCFRYFQLGGACIDGPVGLLAGIIRQPFVLFYHFFAVAFYAIWLRVVAAPVVQKPWVAVVGGGAVLAKAVRVIGPYIVSETRV